MIEVYLEPDTSNYKRLFQLDDSNSLHRKRSFIQTSILKLLFRLPGIILVCQIFWEFIEKIRESEAKDPRKLRERSRSLHQPLILVYFFQLYTASNLDDFKPKGFLFKPKHILKPLSPRKSWERWWCPDTIAKAKMMVAKVSRKVLRKGYMSISQWSLGFDHRSHALMRLDEWGFASLTGLYKAAEPAGRMPLHILVCIAFIWCTLWMLRGTDLKVASAVDCFQNHSTTKPWDTLPWKSPFQPPRPEAILKESQQVVCS